MYRRPNLSETSIEWHRKQTKQQEKTNPRVLRDRHNRVRNITVGFRVSPEENEMINAAVAISGLPKQEYCYRRCLCQDVVVQGNPRVYKGLKDSLEAVLLQLKRLTSIDEVSPELLETIHLISTVLGEMKNS
jgi:hypothetical protein